MKASTPAHVEFVDVHGVGKDGVRLSAAEAPVDLMVFREFQWFEDRGRIVLADENRGERSVESVLTAYRNLVANFEKRREYGVAEDLYISEMTVEQNTARRYSHRVFIRLYGWASRYGSDYIQAAKVLMYALLAFAVLYLLPWSDLNRTNDAFKGGISSHGPLPLRRIGSAIMHSFETGSFAKVPVYRASTLFGRSVELAETLLIPLQAALLLLAVRRRFKR